MLIGEIVSLASGDEISIPTIIFGLLISAAWLPALYQSGLELDAENKRFREFEGTLGSTKGQWILVEDGDYWSIVGINEARRMPGRVGVGSMHFGMSKVYFFSGDWHIEIFKGDYENAVAMAERLSEQFGIPVNDVNKDQNISTSQGGVGRY